MSETMDDSPPGSFRSAWRHRRWRRYLASAAVSSTGDFLYTVALVVYLIDETGSAGWVAAAVIARMVAYTLLGAIGGVIADRFDRRRLMVLLDLVRMLVMLAIAATIWSDGPPALVIVLVAASSALTTPYRPASVAATPLLLPEDNLAAANAAEASIGQLAWFLGPAIGAGVVALSGPETAFLVNAATFALSAWLVSGIGNIGGGTHHDEAADDPANGVLGQLAEGVRAIREVPGLMALTAMLGVVLFAFGIETVVQVLVVVDRLDLDADAVGVLAACTGAGGLLAVPFSAKLATRTDAGRLLAISGLLMGAPLALLAVTDSLVVAGALMVVEGVGNIMLDVLMITLLQRACPDHLLGRVFALQDTSGSLAQLVGTLTAPLLVSLISLEAALWVGGGSLAVISMMLLPALRAMSARTEAARVRLAPVATRLAEIGILGDASQAARERIAQHITTITVSQGEVVFTEGDAAADLYILESGEVTVTTEELGEIRRLHADDWFGEIGLLRGLRRTATITASQPTELLVIPGSVFLDAVTAQHELPTRLAATLHTRLARTHPALVAPAP